MAYGSIRDIFGNSSVVAGRMSMTIAMTRSEKTLCDPADVLTALLKLYIPRSLGDYQCEIITNMVPRLLANKMTVLEY